MNVDSFLFLRLGGDRVGRDCNNFHTSIHAYYDFVKFAHRRKIKIFWKRTTLLRSAQLAIPTNNTMNDEHIQTNKHINQPLIRFGKPWSSAERLKPPSVRERPLSSPLTYTWLQRRSKIALGRSKSPPWQRIFSSIIFWSWSNSCYFCLAIVVV